MSQNHPLDDHESLDDAMLALREEYEQAVDQLESQPEPKEGKELRPRRFPLVVSYLMGVMAAGMLVAAIFLFNAQSKPEMELVEMPALVDPVDPVSGDISPTPPFMFEPPIPDGAIPPPPVPTPWPTPPIAVDSLPDS